MCFAADALRGPPGSDTTPPQLVLEVREQTATRAAVSFRAVDPHLDAASLKCTAWIEAPDGTRVEFPPTETRTSMQNGGLEGTVAWSPRRPGRLIARVEIRDTSRNVASQEQSLAAAGEPNQLQVRVPQETKVARPGGALFPGMPRLAAAQLPLPSPSPELVMPPSAEAGGEDPTQSPEALDEPPLESVPTEGPQIVEPLPAMTPPVDVVPRSPAAELHLRAARNSVAMGDLPEALTRFEEYLKLQPDDHPSRFEYAGLLLQHQQYADAQRQLEKLVAEHGNIPTYRLTLAEVLLRLKQYSAAREQFRLLLTDTNYGLQAAIMVARSYVLEHDIAQAQKLYDEKLRDATNLSIDEKRSLALLLIDMERSTDAVRLLKPLVDLHRDDEALTIALVQAYVRANQRLNALDVLTTVSQRPYKDLGLWLELALELYREQAFVEARVLLQHICAQDPSQQRATLALARTHLRLFEVDVAKQVLGSYQGDRSSRDFSTAVTDYHTLAGEFSEAISITKRRIAEDPHDIEAGILLGNAYQASGQLQLAEAAFQAALQNCAPTEEEKQREIRRLLAANYLRRRLFDAARALFEELVEQQPSDIASRILLIETLIKSDDYGTATQLVIRDLKTAAPRERVALQTMMGYILLEQGRAGEAAEQFRMLTADPNAAFPDVSYGLFRAANNLKQPQLAREALSIGPSPLAPPASWGAGFADRALVYCDCRSAAAVLDDALKCAPENVALLNRRGETALLCDCTCGMPTHRHSFPKIMHRFDRPHCPPVSAMTYFQPAVAISPTNIRARLGVARTLKKQLQFEQAFAEYNTLLKFLPQDVNLVRETARMVEGWKGIERSGNLYVAAQRTLPEENMGAVEDPANNAFGVSKLVGDNPEPDMTGAPPQALLSGELSAKYLRGWRFREAIPYYQGLIEMEPTNEAALFDLAQSYSAIYRTNCAIQTYQQLLDVNPCHVDAMTALERNQLELRPKVIPSYDFQYQHGRDGLANITWQNFSLSERQPLGDENEYFEFGYRQRVLQPTDDRVDPGEVPFLHWQEKYAGDRTIFVDLAVEQFAYGFKTRPTFNAGLDVINNDNGTLTASGFLKNYYANGEAIRQDVYWGGVQIDGLIRPLRLWTLSGFYRVAAFSDHNAVNWFDINSAHTFMQGRQQMRGIIDYSFYSFANQTIFGPVPGSLVGTQWPYWSPNSYSFVTAGVEWKEWLSCDTFKGGNERYYNIFMGAAVDSNGDGYWISKARWQYDFSPRVSWTTDANLTWSKGQIYNAVGVTTYAVIRIP